MMAVVSIPAAVMAFVLALVATDADIAWALVIAVVSGLGTVAGWWLAGRLLADRNARKRREIQQFIRSHGDGRGQ